MQLIDIFSKKFNISVCSEIKPYPDDIDIIIKNDGEIENIKRFLFDKGATLIEENSCVIKHLIYVDNYLYILDIRYNMYNYCEHLSSFKLSRKGNKALIFCDNTNKVFKYVCQARYDKIDHIRRNRKYLDDFFSNNDNFEYISKYAIEGFKEKSEKELIDIIKSRTLKDGVLNYIKSYISLFKSYFNYKYPLKKRKSIAFVGPDGSGKSFYIDKLSYPIRKKSIYMGDWFFKFQGMYNKIMNIGTPYNRFLYFFYIIENYIRSFKVFIYTLQGYCVLIDRFPGTNRNVTKKGILGLLNNISYSIIRKPNNIILLYAEPEIIYKRKQELTIEEIRNIQNGIKSLVGEKLNIIDTSNSNDALNNILRLVYND